MRVVGLWLRVLIDPAIYGVSLLVTFLFLLDAMNGNVLMLFELFGLADQSFAISEVLVAVIPLSLVSILAIIAGLIRLLVSIGGAIRSGSILEVRIKYYPIWPYFVLFAIVLFLIPLVVHQLIDFKNFFSQDTNLDPEKLCVVKTSVLLTIGLTFFATFIISAREVLNSNLQDISRQEVDRA